MPEPRQPDPRQHDAPAPPPARTALVTGASSGIGHHLAVGLARAGLSIAVHGRDAARLDAVLGEVRAAGAPRSVAVVADVTDHAAVADAAERAADALGGLDLLVNNAGVIEAVEVPVWEADPAEWRAVVEADLVGAFHVVRAVVPGMLARGGGRVVDVNSGAGVADSDVLSAYGAAKAGLFRIGGALHAAGHRLGLRSLELAPGVVSTPMTRAAAMHAGRTDWTDPRHVVDLVLAFARGELDEWSGRMVRAGADTPAALVARARRDAGGLPPAARTLRLVPHGPDDPLG